MLAPPEKAQALDRFFVDLPPPRTPDPLLLGDFFVPASATLGALAEIYGLQVAAAHTEITLADYFADQLGKRIKVGDVVELGPIALLAHRAEHGRVTTVGLRLAEPEEPADLPAQLRSYWREDSGRAWARTERRISAGACCTSQAPPNSTAAQNRSPNTVVSRNGSAAT